MTTPQHHLPEHVLIDYATGALSEGASLVAACHLSVCPQCASELERLEAIGGALLDVADQAALGDGSLDAVMARLDETSPAGAPAPDWGEATHAVVPKPLRPYLPGPVDQLAFSRMGRVETLPLKLSTGAPGVSLMRMRAGASVPLHTHRGTELTLVLSGGFTDLDERFGPGDVCVRSESHTHRPTADDDGDCLCLTVLEAPLVMRGPLGRLLNPFLRLNKDDLA